MLIPVIWDASQKIGHASKRKRLVADTTITPGELVRLINNGQATNVITSGCALYVAAKEVRVPEDSDNTLDTLASGDGMIAYSVSRGQFLTTEFDTANITSSTAFDASLGVTSAGLLTVMASGLDAKREVARFKEFRTHSGSGESNRILVEFCDRNTYYSA